MIVAVPAVRVVQVIADEVVDVVAVRHGLVAAAGAVHVAGRVARARVARRAARGVRHVDRDRALVDVAAVGRVQVTVVKVVDVIAVADGDVTATVTVLVLVLVMDRMLAHQSSP